MGADNDEDDHNEIDHEDNLDDTKDGVGYEPGEQLSGAPPHSAQVQQEVGNQQQSQEDQLHHDGLVPAGGQQPLVDLHINSKYFSSD